MHMLETRCMSVVQSHAAVVAPALAAALPPAESSILLRASAATVRTDGMLRLQPTNEAFLRDLDSALLQRLLTSNDSGNLGLLSKFLQFHSVPSPLPMTVRARNLLPL